MSRFLWDEFISDALNSDEDYWPYAIGFDLTLYMDVLPFIGLLLFHYKNFKPSKNLPEEVSNEQEHFTTSEGLISFEPISSSPS